MVSYGQNQARSSFAHSGPSLEVQNQIRCGKLDIYILCKTGSDLDGLVRFLPNASGPEARWCARIIGPGSGRMRPACCLFPIFRLSCNLPQIAQFTLCKTSLDPIWFWLTVFGFGQMDPAWKPESSGLILSQSKSDLHVCWVVDNLVEGHELCSLVCLDSRVVVTSAHTLYSKASVRRPHAVPQSCLSLQTMSAKIK